ncbi:MAG: CPBP family intramembrane metalloprotease [Lachnospiraceae bacterium]|nr:CPBP family intramembrane metalloprotease [Cuneatibacter sp.]MDD6457131.1 CPBP family intramembrane metalloprotease [Lachnospiraceae bacterium]
MQGQNRLYDWWRVLYPVLLQWLISMLVILGFRLYLQTVYAAGLEAGGMDPFQASAAWKERYRELNLVMTAVTHAVSGGVMLILFLRQNAAERLQKPWKGRQLFAIVALLVLGGVACLLLNGVLNLTGLTYVLRQEYGQMAEVLYAGPLWLEIGTTVVLAPIAEELLFRGICQNRLRWLFSPKQAVLAAAILFGVYHGSLLQGVYACALGILIGWSYERFKNIFAPILLHMSANAMSLAMTKWTVLNDFFGKTPIRLGLTVIFCGIFCSFFCRLLEKYSKEF